MFQNCEESGAVFFGLLLRLVQIRYLQFSCDGEIIDGIKMVFWVHYLLDILRSLMPPDCFLRRDQEQRNRPLSVVVEKESTLGDISKTFITVSARR